MKNNNKNNLIDGVEKVASDNNVKATNIDGERVFNVNAENQNTLESKANAEGVDTPYNANIEQNVIVNADGTQTAKTPSKAKVIMEKVFNVLLIVAIVLLITSITLRLFVFAGVRVQQTSMTPTYLPNDVVWVNKTAKPERGDVVVFYASESVTDMDKFKDNFAFLGGTEQKKLIKRVVAVAGDKLWVEKQGEGYVLKVLTTSGEIITEDYYTKDGKSVSIPLMYDKSQTDGGVSVSTQLGNLKSATQQNPFVVTENSIYVMGDNRYNSVDSRSFSSISLDRLFGVVMGE